MDSVEAQAPVIDCQLVFIYELCHGIWVCDIHSYCEGGDACVIVIIGDFDLLAI